MKTRAISLFLMIIVLTGIGFYFWPAAPTNAENSSAAAQAERPAQAVTVQTVTKQSIETTITLPGRISAFRQAQIRPQVDGIIKERLFEEGALVEKGQQLYQIDDARYKANVTAAEADLKSAKSQINAAKAKAARYETLLKSKATSRQTYDDIIAARDKALADVAVAEAALEIAKVNMDYTKVYAPITGRIGRSLVTEGALVTANQENPLSVITQLDPIYVDMQQSSSNAMMLQHGRAAEGQKDIKVTLMLGENNEVKYQHEGHLKFSEVTIDETTGSTTLRAVMPNPDEMLLPGLFVRATLNLGEEQALLVPQRATTRTPNGTLTVFIVDENNVAQQRTLTTTRAYKDSWVVTDGIKEGETLIIEGYQKIASGAPVSPQPAASADTNQPQPQE